MRCKKACSLDNCGISENVVERIAQTGRHTKFTKSSVKPDHNRSNLGMTRYR